MKNTHPRAPHLPAGLRHRLTRIVALSALACAFAATSPARAAESSALPAEQQNQGVTYITGGVDLDQSTAIKAAMAGYPLVVEVFNSAGGKNEYTAASRLSITNPAGQAVFSTDLQGPFALLKLAPGRYDVKVEYEGQTRQRRIDVTSGRSARATFVFGGA
ncbi:MAG: carboxypeptidase regulatory-like domain-containing protein [Rubrivivax sp.]|nr:MAG: carboxypeptidase regulatory-like domain-containing protein [Rubrivivax sp.]